MKIQSQGGNFRGQSPYVDSGFGTGGNQIMNAKTGIIPGSTGMGEWHPTVLYLLGLLVVEWALFLLVTKYL